jgi:two-component system sensor histidine kinase NreB
LLKKLISAQEEERKRIARELHDGVGQMLTSLMVGMRTLQRSDDARLTVPGAHGGTVRHCRRDAGAGARPQPRAAPQPARRPGAGRCVGALRRRVCPRARRHVTVDLHCDLPGAPARSTVETALYRIVQEAMTNAARHGKASAVGVLVGRRANGTAQAIVEDDGGGFDVELRCAGGRAASASLV